MLFSQLAELIRLGGGGPPLRKLMAPLIGLLDEHWYGEHLRRCLGVLQSLEEGVKTKS
jgi:hypothetical protein